MLKVIVILALLAHGIGHVLFLVQVLGIADWGQSAQSWLLGGSTLAKVLGTAVWVVAIVGFSAAGIGMIAQLEWWRTAAIIAAVVSLVGLVLFWSYPNSSSAYFAAAFDILIPITLLLVHWPSVELIGA